MRKRVKKEKKQNKYAKESRKTGNNIPLFMLS